MPGRGTRSPFQSRRGAGRGVFALRSDMLYQGGGLSLCSRVVAALVRVVSVSVQIRHVVGGGLGLRYRFVTALVGACLLSVQIHCVVGRTVFLSPL